MPIFIYNSLTRRKEEFRPLDSQHQHLKMYVCGPTVYDEPHIGHARSAYIFDLIRRYLKQKYKKVTFVRNITDVDDKIIEKARQEYPGEDLNTSFKKVADKYLNRYHEALGMLGIPSSAADIIEPKASTYIGKMIEFINGLISKGVAYQSEGDVYFDIKKANNYGKLSNQSLGHMEVGARIAPGEKKRDPLDFALWKNAKEGEPFWDSPWGKGRPGWHIECSVMSSDILGDEFDIHGGGIDLIFPHHENEKAQSEGAGKNFARYWVHHGLLTINAQKMSKSLGNFVTVNDFLAKYHYPELLKLFFLGAHYSHPIDYTETKIEEARQALERIVILADKLGGRCSKGAEEGDSGTRQNPELIDIENRFMAAMDDDFNTPEALAQLFELVSASNRNIDNAGYTAQAWALLCMFAGLFGLDLRGLQESWRASSQGDNVAEMIRLRIEAKKRKDFAQADRIRKELESKGIILEDNKDGTTWRKKL